MTRDMARLETGVFDLLIVGGGVYGLATAREAALRGLSVALVERDDFGGRTSFNHHKTIHGGLRYLQRGDLVRMRESVRERRAFARIAPQFLRVQPFVFPTRPSLTRGRLAMRAVLSVERILAFDRNRDLVPELRLPAGRLLSREEIAARLPELAASRGSGGALWHEYQTAESERLTLAFALAAAREGAVLANYAEALSPWREGSQITGMHVRDLTTGAAHVVRARLTCNAAGAAAGRLMAAFGIRRPFPLLKAMNVVTRRPAGEVAFGAAAPHGRVLVALPWRGRLAIGTWHGRALAGADETGVHPDELLAFLQEINETFPWLALKGDDITLVHRGLVPARLSRRGPRFLERSALYDHARDGIEGAISIVGVKYTTARATAERAVDLALRKVGLPHMESASAETPLLSGRLDGITGGGGAWTSVLRLYDEAAQHRVEALTRSDPALGLPLVPGVATIGGQVLEAVRNEMALTLEDVVLRRTALGSCGYPGDEAVRAAAGIMAKELGWSAERFDAEVEGVRRAYEIGDVRAF
jgi:glycerol-3-phosphate dehydrogenase